MRKVFITSSFDQRDKSKWPPYVREFLEDPKPESLHNRREAQKVFFKKFNTEKYPRIVFFEETRGENSLLIPRKFFSKHEEYDLYTKLDEREMLKKGKYDSSELLEIEEEFKRFEKKEAPKLPIEMRDIEHDRDFTNIGTSYVFEMEEWVKHIRKSEFIYDKKAIYENLLVDVIVNKREITKDDNGWVILSLSKDSPISVVMRVSVFEGHTYYYLFDIWSNSNLDHLNHKYLTDLSDKVLLKKARKGYPDWILCGDFEDWNNLENDEDANLALSDEEIDVLNKTKYPYFVNGLAGSGKSTILYYLFAHAYSYRSTRKQSLLFLSYSEKLIKKAQNVVLALLKKNPSYVGFKITPEEESNLFDCFSPFIQFLKTNFLDTKEEFDIFEESKRINFDKFQKLYSEDCKLSEIQTYSATIVWSVIRSFIKGRNYKKDFYINDYKEINRDDRTVLVDDYEKIYTIYKNWYKPYYQNKFYWDDLDLVRYVLNKIDSGFVYKRYDIIYCDEAQDFTPIENQLVIKLSSYAEYNLVDYRQIPIAYAGDPNQTVSPTGFSWNRLKDIFSKSFEEQIGGFISLKQRTLNNNYRSKTTIVKFANSIQYLRKTFLPGDSYTPQEQWNPQANPLPGFFFIDSDKDKAFVKRGFEKTECIITGDEGEYIKELDSDELTKESTQLSDEIFSGVNKTKLYTAVSSKGLEFKAVILYKFADYLPKSFDIMLSGSKELEETDKYELSHFFTKLYIAISRAKELMYILDTNENFEKFWKYFIDNALVKNLLENRQERDVWLPKTGGIEIGDEKEYINRLADNFSPLDLADEIFKGAKVSKDAKDMRRACGYYEEGGNFEKANLAKAYVMLFENKYFEAGEMFMGIGYIDEADDAYWKGACWKELAEGAKQIWYLLAAQFMIGTKQIQDIISNKELLDYIQRSDETWTKVVLELQDKSKNIEIEDIYEVCEFFERLIQKGFNFLNDTIANLYFRNKMYSKAVNKWDQLNKTTHPDYFAAREEIAESSSELIYWKSRANKNKELLEKYSGIDDAKNLELDERARGIIFNLLLSEPKNFLKAFDYPYSKEDRLRRLYGANSLVFIQHYVFKDFDYEKYVVWVENRLYDEANNIFSHTWNDEFLKDLFAAVYSNSNQKKEFLWSEIFGKRDVNDYRFVKNENNRDVILDFLPTVLGCEDMTKDVFSLREKKEEMKVRAFAFFDFLFDRNYNYPKAKRFDKDLVRIFSSNEFNREEFRFNAQRNKYFLSCGLEVKDIDIIKDNISGYIKQAFSEIKKKVKDGETERILSFCNIFEKVVPYIQEATVGDKVKYVPDYRKIIDYFKGLKKTIAFKENNLLLDFLNSKILMNEIRLSSRTYTVKRIFDELEKQSLSTESFIGFLDREDFIKFTGVIFGKQCLNIEYAKKVILPISERIYNFNIRVSDFDSRMRNNLVSNIESSLDAEVEELLNAEKINEYALKLYAYVYEVVIDAPADIAAKYDYIIHNKRISKLARLCDYLKERALNRYAHVNREQFNAKVTEYGVYRKFEDWKDYRHPIIEKDVPKQVVEELLIEGDSAVNGFNIEIKASKRLIWFSKDGEDLVTISKGKIEVDNDAESKVMVKGNTFNLSPFFSVIVNSDVESFIETGDKRYRIDLRKIK